jgi:rhomboid protease GluP
MGSSMVGTGSIIPARSQEQALDWSLVLLSQGIESEIGPTEGGRWQIAVDSGEFGRAARMLRLYCLENRHRPQRTIDPPKLLFDWGNAWFFVLLIAIFVLSQTRLPLLPEFGRMSAAFFEGEWWRPFTAVLLHRDAAHLAMNFTIGLLFIGVAGGMFGTWRALAISYISGAGANVIGALIKGAEHRSLGASGMVMGALGLLTAFAVADFHEMNRRRWALRGVAGGILLLVLLGFDPQPRTDVLAHVSGFLLGLFLGTATLWFQRRRLSEGVERLQSAKAAEGGSL